MTSRSDAIAALRAADPVLAKVIDEVGADGPGDLGVTISSDRYGALVRSSADVVPSLIRTTVKDCGDFSGAKCVRG